MLTDAAHEYFRRRAAVTRRQLKRLFRVGRISLVIGIVFATVAASLGEVLSSLVSQQSHVRVLTESLVIFGWVALWRPAEIFLYDWWPIRAEAKMFDRLGAMQVSCTLPRAARCWRRDASACRHTPAASLSATAVVRAALLFGLWIVIDQSAKPANLAVGALSASAQRGAVCGCCRPRSVGCGSACFSRCCRGSCGSR